MNKHRVADKRRFFTCLMVELLKRLDPEEQRQFYIRLLYPDQQPVCEKEADPALLDQAIGSFMQQSFDW